MFTNRMLLSLRDERKPAEGEPSVELQNTRHGGRGSQVRRRFATSALELEARASVPGMGTVT